MKGIDCSTPLTPETAAAFKRWGADAVGRYIGRHTNGWYKAMDRPEPGIIHAAGLALWLIWESNPTSKAFFTFNEGVLEGGKALADADWLGAPSETGIVFTVDYDAAEGDMTVIEAYFKGVRQSVGKKYLIGGYGKKEVVEALKAAGLIDFEMQTAAWSNGKVASELAIYQDGFGKTIAGVGVDIDEIYCTDGFWLPGGKPEMELMLNSPYKAEVEGLQKQLRTAGVYAGAIDGAFGPGTEKAVKAFQKLHGLKEDGIVGPKTQAELDAAAAAAAKPPDQVPTKHEPVPAAPEPAAPARTVVATFDLAKAGLQAEIKDGTLTIYK